MCSWNDISLWKRQFCGLLFSGLLIFICLCVVAYDLQISKPTVTTVEKRTFDPIKIPNGILTYSTTTATVKMLDLKKPPTVDNPSKEVMNITQEIAATYLEKLGWFDILLLLIIWPIWIFFSRVSRNLTIEICNRWLK